MDTLKMLLEKINEATLDVSIASSGPELERFTDQQIAVAKAAAVSSYGSIQSQYINFVYKLNLPVPDLKLNTLSMKLLQYAISPQTEDKWEKTKTGRVSLANTSTQFLEDFLIVQPEYIAAVNKAKHDIAEVVNKLNIHPLFKDKILGSADSKFFVKHYIANHSGVVLPTPGYNVYVSDYYNGLLRKAIEHIKVREKKAGKYKPQTGANKAKAEEALRKIEYHQEEIRNRQRIINRHQAVIDKSNAQLIKHKATYAKHQSALDPTDRKDVDSL